MILMTRQQLKVTRRDVVHHHSCDGLHLVREGVSTLLSALTGLNVLISSRLWTFGMEVSRILIVRRLLHQVGVTQDCQTLSNLRDHWFELKGGECLEVRCVYFGVESCSDIDCWRVELKSSLLYCGASAASPYLVDLLLNFKPCKVTVSILLAKYPSCIRYVIKYP